ncbi:heme exporter protein CcmB [Lysobacter sp. 5GHs7-4]|uniref:heme exporter protein CcmB n=1 Tax=Lysobacter sp. 5GHs7-4 TaxID=2904253 RepID=UPI001E5AD11C|nr:heme exporter protein CcmB [Lysobacter sp. 5GHs7-4]UHQ21652.1 heme exporter protein CcmB [Lysobacter sp. 5GHs7-4]
MNPNPNPPPIAGARRPGTAALPGLAGAARALLARDLRLLWRRRGDALQPAMFALLVVVLFALALGGEAQALAKVAGAVLWLAVLLAGLLALDTLFRGDAEDGSLEQWMLAPVPLGWLVAVRTFMHWATTALPLLIATPFLAELLHLPRAQLPVLLASLALGTPLLSLLGAVVAALTVGMRRSGILVALLALPLYVPVLVFGAGSVAASAQGLDATGGLLLLGAGLVVALVLAPLAAAAAIRIALN